MLEQAANRFPDFDREIQGAFREPGVGGVIRFRFYVVQLADQRP